MSNCKHVWEEFTHENTLRVRCLACFEIRKVVRSSGFCEHKFKLHRDMIDYKLFKCEKCGVTETENYTTIGKAKYNGMKVKVRRVRRHW